MVYDDAGYGAEFHHFDGADHATVRFPETDLAAIAAGYGAAPSPVRCGQPTSTPCAELARPGRGTGPMLVDAKVRADEPSWWLAEAFR